MIARQMRHIEKTVASVCDASPGEFVDRQGKCNEAEICETGECLGKAALENYHNTNKGLWTIDMLQMLTTAFAAVHYRID